MAPKPLNIKRDCTHNGRHKHGTARAYKADKCRCADCRIADRRSRMTSDLRRYAGIPVLIDATPVRRHIKRLHAQGMGARRIAEIANVNRKAIHYITHGQQTVTVDLAKRLLAVHLDIAPGAFIDPAGTRRRIEALVWLGRTFDEIGVELGYQSPAASHVVRQWTQHANITKRVADNVEALYEKWWNAPVPTDSQYRRQVVSRTRNFAIRNGYMPPMAWDDETIDDPNAKPMQGIAAGVDEIKVEQATLGRLTWARLAKCRNECTGGCERGEAVATLASWRLSDNEIATRLGTYVEAIHRLRTSHGVESRWAA